MHGECGKEPRLLNHLKMFSYKHFLVNNSSVTHSSNIICLFYSLPSTIALAVPFTKHPIFASCHKSTATQNVNMNIQLLQKYTHSIHCDVQLLFSSSFTQCDARSIETRHFLNWIPLSLNTCCCTLFFHTEQHFPTRWIFSYQGKPISGFFTRVFFHSFFWKRLF